MSLSDDSLYREVDEEVRRQKIQDLWKRWGNLFLALCIAVITVVAAYKAWQFWQLKKAEEAARSYFAAVELTAAGKADEAMKKFAEVAAGSHKGYKYLAELNMAARLAATGKKDQAIKEYDEIAATSSVDPNLRAAARIRAAYLLVDTAPHEEIVKRVADLNQPDNIWRNHAREVLALSAYRANDYTETDRLMNEVVLDAEAPEGLRQRAQVMISLLAPRLDAKKPVVQ
ncbi:MAG TPA: tetratricopeptide repeat protein [Aestuariivirgaceae bacterium]|jgi:hypothetical protein